MSDATDRRIQLRESIHQLVVDAAARRCVTPAAFVGMLVYEYLQARNELTVVSSVPNVMNARTHSDGTITARHYDPDEVVVFGGIRATRSERYKEGYDDARIDRELAKAAARHYDPDEVVQMFGARNTRAEWYGLGYTDANLEADRDT